MRLVPAVLAAALLLAGCRAPDTPIGGGTSSSGGVRVPATEPDSTTGTGGVAVNTAKQRQTIEGFGGATAWKGSLPADAVIKALFDPVTGAGLTLIRNRIPFREDTASDSNNDGFMAKASSGHYTYTLSGGHKTFSLSWGNWDLSTTKSLFAKAKVYSADIRGFSTAWTPPNNQYDLWKINDGTASHNVGGTKGSAAAYPSVGGVLDPSHYQDYADVLADYAKNFENNMGYPLAGLSVQNEPNWMPQNYESCWWDAAAFTSFAPHLTSAWKAKAVTTPVIAPESFSFGENLITGVLAASPKVIAIVATHQYDATGISDPSSNYGQTSDSFHASWFPSTKAAGKRLWETEVSTTGGSNDSSIQDGIYWARMIHADLTVAEVNAFCAWWLWDSGAAALIQVPASGSPVFNKRLYTLGQYSRFVRPGWVRLDADPNPTSNVETTAFKDPNSHKFAVVLINSGGSQVTVPVTTAKTMTSAELFRTSATEDLADVGALATGTGKTLSVVLPAFSVSTVSGVLAP